jgi:hypothetical protein
MQVHHPPLFCSKDIASLTFLNSKCLRVAENRTIALQHRFHAVDAPFDVCRCGVLPTTIPCPQMPRRKGRVTMFYQDDAILPENREAIKKEYKARPAKIRQIRRRAVTHNYSLGLLGIV